MDSTTRFEAFEKILTYIRMVLPGSHPIIGGGALRDTFHDRPIKDIDVFLRAEDYPGGLDSPFLSNLIPPSISEYVGRKDLHGVYNFKEQIEGFDVQIILADYDNLKDLAGTFDIGLSRITYNGDVLFIHPDFRVDSANKVFRIIRDESPSEVERSQRRITRLLQKYPEFTQAA